MARKPENPDQLQSIKRVKQALNNTESGRAFRQAFRSFFERWTANDCPDYIYMSAAATATARAEIAAATAAAKAEIANATATAQAESDAVLKAPREDGIWLVGVDMAPGTWRNNGTGDKCYWQRSTKTQDIIDNHYGLGGGAATISASDFQFESTGCGTWTYLGR